MRPNRVIDTYPRETDTYLPIRNATVDGLPATADQVEVSVVAESARPGPWVQAVLLDEGIGFRLNGPALGRGVFTAYGRVDTEVWELGQIRLT